MAQWSRSDRTLYAKLVYYGPAYGGKTTNLQTLHRITDPAARNRLLSVKTADDRTLFFDLLPFDLGDILGYQVAMKLYTVPGQVRYDTTRQVVLSGADAVIFVADSTRSRQDKNAWSMQNLQMNMRAKRLDPNKVPVLFQFNKQDLSEAAPPEEVARWLGIRPEQGFPAVATEGRGVVETFMSACRAMLQRIISMADERTRRGIDSGELDRQLEHAFRPYLERGRAEPPAPPRRPAEGTQTPIVLEGDDLLERAVTTGVRLGEKLSVETARAIRLESEAEALRRLSESLRGVGASFDREQIIDATLAATAEILQAPIVSLVRQQAGGSVSERCWGAPRDPLLGFPEGEALIERMLAAGGPCIVENLRVECGGVDADSTRGLRGLAGVPVLIEESRMLLAYAPDPDGLFDHSDVRFMATLAGHLGVGLEKSRLYDELARHRDRLVETVAARTEELREAYEELRQIEEMKDRFLSNLSHEMRTPLTATLSAATALRDYRCSARERKELSSQIVSSAETLQRQLDDLFRLVHLENGTQPLRWTETDPRRLSQESIELAGHASVQRGDDAAPQAVTLDLSRMVRAVANLLDNAVKFSKPGAGVELRLGTTQLDDGREIREALVVSVLDRGPGVAPAERERIFAPFEQGGHRLTDKPAGIGLGLHEARTIVRRHGGTIEVRSREGGGSEFRIVVPTRPKGARLATAELAHV